MSESISIKSCASIEEAEFFKSIVESSGIHAIVMADDDAGLPLLVSGGVQLQVLEKDVERARTIIEESVEHE